MMLEWILAGILGATALMLIVQTIEEAVRSAQPLRTHAPRCSVVPTRDVASERVLDVGDENDADKKAA